jgi:hypothetical protein
MIQRPPRFPKNKIAKILYATQIAVDAPTFVMFVNHKSRVNFAFKKRVENTIRKHFGFIGVPIVVKYRNRNEQAEHKDDDYTTLSRPVEIPHPNAKNVNDKEHIALETGSPLISNNPYNHKGKRKREQKSSPGIKRPNGTRTPPKRTSKYTNIKQAKQGKLNEMFSKVYGDKSKGTNRK